MSAAGFPVTHRRELGADQFSLVGKKKHCNANTFDSTSPPGVFSDSLYLT